ncbi:hypothetical protein CC80DRAFT_494353 [Byssothecium circinans]|uniref:Uncharacterized protein n=1 Tax=Byssothecium circinans TaxID=147558 RepID=A0A6A5TMY9_9PLEO|nr:hypothetical protein CC80DRAFT_494353 [Byssothecium circinans]
MVRNTNARANDNKEDSSQVFVGSFQSKVGSGNSTVSDSACFPKRPTTSLNLTHGYDPLGASSTHRPSPTNDRCPRLALITILHHHSSSIPSSSPVPVSCRTGQKCRAYAACFRSKVLEIGTGQDVHHSLGRDHVAIEFYQPCLVIGLLR